MRILIANRGEIAVRIAKSINALGFDSIGILPYGSTCKLLKTTCKEIYNFSEEYSEIQNTYLSIENIINIAKEAKADAIHPGYGFLSESAEFASTCKENNIIFIGPSAKTLKLLGDKVASKKLATELNIPTIQGFDIPENHSIDSIKNSIKNLTLPLIIKASFGGGGRGMRIVQKIEDLESAILSARSEAERAFGNGSLFVEKYINPAKHIEIQIFGDTHGSCIHLFERDCSLQRKHQKIIEIAPSLNIKKSTLEKLYQDSVNLGTASKLSNAATVEFLLDKDENFFFIECNPRLQVEHTITEEITGIDIVKLQIMSAIGKKIPNQSEIKIKGCAIQARVCAEIPEQNFSPSTGQIELINYPEDIRVDNGYSHKEYITTDYDSLVFKVVSYSDSHESSLNDLKTALECIAIYGVSTNIAFLLRLINHQKVKKHQIYTNLIEEILKENNEYQSLDIILKDLQTFMSNHLFSQNPDKKHSANEQKFLIKIPQLNLEKVLSIPIAFSREQVINTSLHSITNHIPSFSSIILNTFGYCAYLTTDLSEQDFSYHDLNESGDLKAPLPCSILKIFIKEGDSIKKDQELLKYESMKTEYTLLAPSDGGIKTIHCNEGDKLNKEDMFLTIFS